MFNRKLHKRIDELEKNIEKSTYYKDYIYRSSPHFNVTIRDKIKELENNNSLPPIYKREITGGGFFESTPTIYVKEAINAILDYLNVHINANRKSISVVKNPKLNKKNK